MIAENHRAMEVQLASLRFFDCTRNCLRYASLFLPPQDILKWLPIAYVQYVRFQGTGLASDVASEKRSRAICSPSSGTSIPTSITFQVSQRPCQKRRRMK
jgi:hypothetical protein